MQSIILGSGCFWCSEAVFQRVKGIVKVTSGYAGGKIVNPNYNQVCSGQTGHAEVVKLDYDPSLVSLDKILDIFWQIHDPTSLNQQGADIGTQYRSIVFYTDSKQKQVIQNSKTITQQEIYPDKKIVTEIKKLDVFYPAELYHQNYFNKHPDQAYCQIVIKPKVEKISKI
ncbi:peptide-methionine (S)-S-oxide reductase [Candidatus Beckwithbacteria bacterium CG23_combo_of_CG06-09_8_20_14_all_34_8]|uniref:Peptide methionine sulfoxide reductase MsrA n=1 Tax=Candidatus Beckwithbacteria bacterium CG23_combo_of_CG06-09_8_20_14_all_34_8 TaxID=1974497 RepID=A0A2H0B4Y6_9BACT|nr:MAG: peptide-methionine (S)-S-oxide reductase [Candidatus Beckwithbacteria bacterium CG23_combo_of_CG06-09_8_20_14_all_34_8]